jgi:hypothetical protein
LGGDNDNENNNVGEALSSVTTAAVDFVVNTLEEGPDVDAVEIARKQRLVQDRQLKTTYKVTLPLASATTKKAQQQQQQQQQSSSSSSSMLNLGITLCQISKGRKVESDVALNLDTLEMEAVSRPVVDGEDGTTDAADPNDRMDVATIQRRIDGEFQGLVVASVQRGSSGWAAGVRPGDILKTTSATLGGQLWPKSTLEGVKSALVSRKAVSESVQFEFQRLRETVDNQFELSLTRPIGLQLKGRQRGRSSDW